MERALGHGLALLVVAFQAERHVAGAAVLHGNLLQSFHVLLELRHGSLLALSLRIGITVEVALARNAYFLLDGSVV